jgi:hypothetical protein
MVAPSLVELGTRPRRPGQRQADSCTADSGPNEDAAAASRWRRRRLRVAIGEPARGLWTSLCPSRLPLRVFSIGKYAFQKKKTGSPLSVVTAIVTAALRGTMPKRRRDRRSSPETRRPSALESEDLGLKPPDEGPSGQWVHPRPPPAPGSLPPHARDLPPQAPFRPTPYSLAPQAPFRPRLRG